MVEWILRRMQGRYALNSNSMLICINESRRYTLSPSMVWRNEIQTNFSNISALRCDFKKMKIDPCAIQMTSFVEYFIIHGARHARNKIDFFLLAAERRPFKNFELSPLERLFTSLLAVFFSSYARFWWKGKRKMWSSLNTKWRQYEPSQPRGS